VTESKAEHSREWGLRVVVFILATTLAGVAVVAAAAIQWRGEEIPALAVLAVYAAFSIRFEITLFNQSRASVAVAPILAAGSIGGLPGIVLVSLAAELAAYLGGKTPYYKSVFNAGALLVSGAAYVGIINLLPGGAAGIWPNLVYATLFGTMVNLFINSAIVAAVIAWSSNPAEKVVDLWKQTIQSLLPHYVMLGVLVACMGSAYTAGGMAPMTVVFLPVIVTRLAMNLQQNRDDLEKEHLRSQYLAYHDSLTDLPNRRLFEDQLATALARARLGRRMVAVLFLDLDEFKPINDRFGHSSGDRLLQDVARRLQAATRTSDLVARVGGDEFLLMSENISSVEDAQQMATRVMESLGDPWSLDGQIVEISASVGVAICPQDGEDSRTLLKNADAAMYNVKWLGGNGYSLYTPATDDGRPERGHRSYALACDKNGVVAGYGP
jgi:diguanylate cyclase (GGDEF)-like protein